MIGISRFVSGSRILLCRLDAGSARRRDARRRRYHQASFRDAWLRRRCALLFRRRDSGCTKISDALVVNNFEIADGGQAARAPVDHVTSAINQAIAIEAQESFEHGAIERRLESKTLARPIARSAQANHLFLDHAAAFRFPFPNAALEFFAAQILALDSFLGEHAFDDELRGDSGVVHAGQPERSFAAHAMPANEHVDLRVLEHVADVNRASNVGRRKSDGESAAAAVAGIFRAK